MGPHRESRFRLMALTSWMIALALCAIIEAILPSQAAAGLFTGKRIGATSVTDGQSGVVDPPVATVNDAPNTPEFVIHWFDYNPPPFTADFSGDRIILRFQGWPPPFTDGAFHDGSQQITFTDVDNTIPDFTGATLVRTPGVSGFDQSRISVTVNSITLNVGSHVFWGPPGSFIEIQVGPAPPRLTNLTAEVGSGEVKLHWVPDPPDGAIDRVRIAIDDFNGTSFVTFGTQVLRGTPPTNEMSISESEAGDALQNGTLYRFTVSAEVGSTQGEPSEPVYAEPNSLAFTAPAHPNTPILFLHGFFGDEKTFTDTATFMNRTLGWSEGELLTWARAISPVPLPFADFYRAKFSDNTGSLDKQGDEVCQFLRALSPRRVSILAHSNGGLAARACFKKYPELATLVRQFITYGTPHRGADVDTATVDALLLAAFPLIPPGLPTRTEAAALALALGFTQGAADAALRCNADGSPRLSTFLTDLSTKPLPLSTPDQPIRYVAIIGHIPDWAARFFPRLSSCLGRDWDGLVPVDSANLRKAGLGVVDPASVADLIHRTRFHALAIGEGNDFSAWLCALEESHCVNVTIRSPVAIEIVAPDGRMLSRQIVELPGASFIETIDEAGHPIDSALIPFPTPGTYGIYVTPKPGAAPTDTFTITLTQNGVTTVIAKDMKIQDIPLNGFAVPVDGVPPTTTATAVPARNVSGWNNTNVTVTLIAVDNPGGSGVKQIRYSLSGAQAGGGGGAASRVSVTMSAEGITTLTYFATDNAGNQEAAKTLTVRIDKTPPTVTCRVSPNTLWPPNNKLVPVTASVGVSDSLSGSAGFALRSITNNEALAAGDVQGFAVGTSTTVGQLMATRSGNGSGRFYTLTYQGLDAAGNAALCSTTVTVPHDQGK